MHRLVGHLDEPCLNVYLGYGLVNRLDDLFAICEYLLRRRDDHNVGALERRGDLAAARLAGLGVASATAKGAVEQFGKILRRCVVQHERAREHRLQLFVLAYEVDVAARLEAELLRVEDRLEGVQPRDVPERHGNALLEVRRIGGDDVCARRLAELTKDVRKRGVVAVDVHEASGHGHFRHRRLSCLVGRRRSRLCDRGGRRGDSVRRDGGLRHLHRGRLAGRVCGVIQLVEVDFVCLRCLNRDRRGRRLFLLRRRFGGKGHAAHGSDGDQDFKFEFHFFAPLLDCLSASPDFSRYFARTRTSFSLLLSESPSTRQVNRRESWVMEMRSPSE